jgi:hypothetical protein
MSDLESAVISYLEKKGYTPEYSSTKTRFRHPQRASRLVSIERLPSQAVAICFLNCSEVFAEKWTLSSQGELPAGLYLLEIIEALEDFFLLVEEEAPPGAPPFEVRLKEVAEIIHRYASRNQRNHHYELSYEDLLQIGRNKAYEVWLLYGDKPLQEFQCLVAASIQRRIDSLLSKHYVSKRRAGAEVIALSPEMTEILPEEGLADWLVNADWLDYAATLLPAQRILLENLLNPSKGLRRDHFIEDLRYCSVRAQFPKSRLLPPKFKIDKIAAVTGLPVEELQKAYDTLRINIETDAWNDLIFESVYE